MKKCLYGIMTLVSLISLPTQTGSRKQKGNTGTTNAESFSLIKKKTKKHLLQDIITSAPKGSLEYRAAMQGLLNLVPSKTTFNESEQNYWDMTLSYQKKEKTKCQEIIRNSYKGSPEYRSAMRDLLNLSPKV